MKHILPLIVASFMLAIAQAMLEDGPFPLPFLVGYLLGIVVPVVVFSGILTLVAAGIYRVYTGKDMPNLSSALWGIWVLVAAVNFYGNYHDQTQMRNEYAYDTEEEPGRHPAVLSLQSRFAQDSRQLDAELAGKVATIRIPPLFDSEFLKDKSRFPDATGQLEDYGRLFQQYRASRIEMFSQLKTGIEQLDLPKKEKLQAIHEFENTYEIDAALHRKYYDIVIEVSQQGIAYLDFLDGAHYRVSNGRVTFKSDTDADRYQAFLETFSRLSELEVAAQRELADSRQKRMAHLKGLQR